MTTFQKIIATVVLMLTVLGAMVFLSWRRDVEYERCLEFLRKAPEGINSSKCVDVVFRRELQLESSKPTPTSEPKPKLYWSPKPTTESEKPQVRYYVKILETPTGWLRAREEPITNSKEVAKVKADEVYPVLTELEGWYKIHIADGLEGWISKRHTEKVEP